MRDVARLSRQELVDVLKELAKNNSNDEEFRKAVAEALPGIAATITYSIHCGMKMYMGMAMSHYHPGNIQF